LSPSRRFWLKRGIPLLLICAALWVGFADPDQRARLRSDLNAYWDAIQDRPEFQVSVMAIDGASDVLASQIRTRLALSFPTSSFDLVLPDLRARIQELNAVKQVHLRIRPNGVLQVDVVERQPALVWRRAETIEVLDGEGVSIGTLALRSGRPDLPLVAGKGADVLAAEALSLLDAAVPIADRVRGLVRVGERRWDLVLADDVRIMLPPQNPLVALDQVIHLHQTQALLDQAISHVDMRLPNRETVRRTTTSRPALTPDGMPSNLNDPLSGLDVALTDETGT
jgi:cell division protein FtsQ